MILVGERDRDVGKCGCRVCWSERRTAAGDLPFPESIHRPFIVCDVCGNKRCPHGTDHRLLCTNSNEAGQKGSDYE